MVQSINTLSFEFKKNVTELDSVTKKYKTKWILQTRYDTVKVMQIHLGPL